MSNLDSACLPVPRPPDEEDRLAVLQRYHLLDTPPSDEFDLLSELAAKVCEAPYALISLVDRERVWVKSYSGMEVQAFGRDNCYCSLAILNQEFTEIPDLELDARTAAMPITLQAPFLRMYSGITLRTSDGYALGTLCVLDTRPRVLNEVQRAMLQRLARQVMALIELHAHERWLKHAVEKLDRLATTDDLTGLHNRRSLLERLTMEAARAKRYRTPLAAVMIDLDFFKRINDHHGHATGDLVLANVGSLVRESVRSSDIAGRYGGEELCVILPETGLAGSCKFAETLRRRLLALGHGVDGLGPVSASLGVAVIDHTGGDATSLLKQADEALYRAKHAGRNRVEC